jgi:ABC-type Mn2+/Zn2+ transport system permease subunit
VIAEFVSSWPLFHNAYVAGWMIAVMLSLTGVVVVARNQIFIGAAVAQASTLGIALSMWMASWLGSEVLTGEHVHGSLSFVAVLFAIGAALFTARQPDGGRTHEATTGWLFLACASLAILVLAHSPHGLEEINHLVSSSIIGATRADAWLFGGLALAAAAGVVAARERLMLYAIDPAMAAAVGMRTAWWGAGLAAWLGLAVGLSMRATGLLYTFGCLVLPALVATAVCRETRTLFVVAPLVALATAVVGFVLANHSDDPPAQMAVALQSAVLLAAWIARRVRLSA